MMETLTVFPSGTAHDTITLITTFFKTEITGPLAVSLSKKRLGDQVEEFNAENLLFL